MKFISESEGRIYTPEGHDASIFSRSLVQSGLLDVHITTFPSKSGMQEEVHLEKCHLFYVLEGEMTVLKNGCTEGVIRKNGAVFIDAGEKHEIANRTAHDMVFLAITYRKEQ